MVMDREQALSLLDTLLEHDRLRAIDKMFAHFIVGQERHDPLLAGMLAAYFSERLGAQDTCVSLREMGQPFAPYYLFPPFEDLQESLGKCTMVQVLESPATYVTRPLVIENDRGYLQRYWDYENRIARVISQRAGISHPIDPAYGANLIEALFGQAESNEIDWQRVAATVAAHNNLTFITGGPGTGKTTTVSRLLALLQGHARKGGKILNIEMVAPTGKAAARLSESMESAKSRLPEALREGLPHQCSTIHRLLGTIPNSHTFRHNAENPLHLDVLVVDEASMVDLPLMCKLLEAVPVRAQIIMLGDRQQLASVEAGTVLSDICQAAMQERDIPPYSSALLEKVNLVSGVNLVGQQLHAAPSLVSDNLVNLQKSHRFSSNSGIGRLASAVNGGDVEASLKLLEDARFADIKWCPTEDQHHLLGQLLPGYKSYLKAVDEHRLKDAFSHFYQQQVLCAQRNGQWGVTALNQRIEGELGYQGKIDLSREYYIGRPIMLSENDHMLKLYNGDIGVVMPDPSNPGVTKVWFADQNGEFRGILPSRLPGHDTVFAMTIHKSQGSEFNNVYLCLPDGKSGLSARGISRELLYTGLTRAKKQFTIYATKPVIGQSIQSRCLRSSGLAWRLESKKG